MSQYQSKILKIDSSKASIYYNQFKTSFSFNVSPPISVSNDQVLIYSLTNAWIPYSFYAVNKYNQYLDVSETINGIVTNRTVIFPAGNYSAYDWSKTFTTYMTTSTIIYSVSYNRNNNRYTISTGPNTSSRFLLGSGPNASISCNKLLGLDKVDTLINNVGLLSGLVTMNDIYYFQIKTNIGDSASFITADESDSILEIIPVSSEPLSFISYAPFQPNKFFLHSNSLTEIRIGLVDNYGRDVNLSNIPFMLTIKIDVIDPAEAGFSNSKGRGDEMVPDEQKTNLELILENPGLINKATPTNTNSEININDLIEYNLINQMLNKVRRKKKSKSI